MGTVTTPLWSIGTELAVTRRREEMILVIGMMTVMKVGVAREEGVGEMAGEGEAAREGMTAEEAVVAGEEVVAGEAVVAGEEEVATLQSPVGGSRLLTRACATPTTTPTGSCTRYVLHAVELAFSKSRVRFVFLFKGVSLVFETFLKCGKLQSK